MQTRITHSTNETTAHYGLQKMQVLFVGNNPFIDPHDRLGEIEFNRATLEEAIHKILKKRIAIDAVVADATFGMPQIKILRETLNKRELPLILYSLSFDHKIRDLVKRLGIDDYFWDSMPHTCAARLKFTIRLKKFRIQWLKYERKHHSKKETFTLQLLERASDIVVSMIGLILLLPVILLIPFTKEIELIKYHVFSDSKKSPLINRIFNWYEFLVLIIFSPIFLLIKTIVKILLNDELAFVEMTHPSYTHDKTGLDMLLAKTGISKWPQLIKVLKGEVSLFGSNYPLL